MANVIKIVVTGGPCSGKSTAIENVAKHYKKKGYSVFVVNETARELIDNGASRDDMLQFEKAVYSAQIKAEDQLMSFINSNCYDEDDTIIILYDRGLVDTLSYLDDTQKQQMNIDIIDAWCRYDAVMFLETANCYVNDDARIESESEAHAISDALLSCWMGHPHLRYIKSCDSFDDKIKSLRKEVKALVKNIELEKKYLIEYPILNQFDKYKPFKAEIEQIYLLSDIGSHRIRKRGTNGNFAYFETVKIRIDNEKCYEHKSIISKEKYDELKKLANPTKLPIIKDRYCFLYDGQYFEMDVYPFWHDKAVIELEITSKNQEINLPPEIQVIKDVSKDKKYKNNHLASMLYENSKTIVL